jgi:hypothetical protein
MILRRIAPLAAALLVSCASAPAPVPSPPPPAAQHHHELHLPPVGPAVRVSFDGRSVDVPLASLARDAASAPLLDLWKAAWAGIDAANLRFDLTGSDGFHPASRPLCARLLTGAEVAAARIDLVTHDVSFDPTLQLPGCYRVKAVVAMDAVR